MRTIEFNGDPMLQLEKINNIDECIFYLNQEALEEIASYSVEPKEIPPFFAGKKYDFMYLAEGGIDEEGNEFPDTYIGVSKVEGQDYDYKMEGIYASDFQYSAPSFGEEIFLKKNSIVLKKDND